MKHETSVHCYQVRHDSNNFLAFPFAEHHLNRLLAVSGNSSTHVHDTFIQISSISMKVYLLHVCTLRYQLVLLHRLFYWFTGLEVTDLMLTTFRAKGVKSQRLFRPSEFRGKRKKIYILIMKMNRLNEKNHTPYIGWDKRMLPQWASNGDGIPLYGFSFFPHRVFLSIVRRPEWERAKEREKKNTSKAEKPSSSVRPARFFSPPLQSISRLLDFYSSLPSANEQTGTTKRAAAAYIPLHFRGRFFFGGGVALLDFFPCGIMYILKINTGYRWLIIVLL